MPARHTPNKTQYLDPEVAEQIRQMRIAGNPQWKAYFRALRKRGYSYEAIGAALQITRQRALQLDRKIERDRKAGVARYPITELEVPLPSYVDPRKPKPEPRIPLHQLALVLGYWKLSSPNRGAASQEIPQEAVEGFKAAVSDVLRDGYTTGMIARQAGINIHALRQRLHRYRVLVSEIRGEG